LFSPYYQINSLFRNNIKKIMKKAVIDLGTNTFHVLIFEDKKLVFNQSIAAKIGMGGISEGIISEEGIQRALSVLTQFRGIIETYGIDINDVKAFGTSAIRNASNQETFVERIRQETGIRITVISGDEEAQLIYQGVLAAMPIPETSLVMDIGGGSVEFIIGKENTILWKQSFEIGGQRLIDKFMKTDPISRRSIDFMDDFLREQLLPLANACHQYAPKILIGSSGSFDTLIDMYHAKYHLEKDEKVAFNYELSEFYWAYEQLVFQNRDARLAIPEMIPLRVDMIVVAMCLIRLVIQSLNIQEIKVSSYALKEGAMIHFS